MVSSDNGLGGWLPWVENIDSLFHAWRLKAYPPQVPVPDVPLRFMEAAMQCVCKNYKQGFYHNKDTYKMYEGFGKAFEEVFSTPEESSLNFVLWQHFDTAAGGF